MGRVGRYVGTIVGLVKYILGPKKSVLVSRDVRESRRLVKELPLTIVLGNVPEVYDDVKLVDLITVIDDVHVTLGQRHVSKGISVNGSTLKVRNGVCTVTYIK